MLIRIPKSWEIKESNVVSEATYYNRRSIIKAIGAAGVGIGSLASLSVSPLLNAATIKTNTNPNYKNTSLGVAVTPESISSKYNNFYEFGSHKGIYQRAQKLRTNDWTINVAGHAEVKGKLSLENILKKVKLEERFYRFRCVEAWAMAVPWIGFTLNDLLKQIRPTSKAKYVVFQTASQNDVMPAIDQLPWYPWAYKEAITIEEAKNELTFMVTGAYGKDLPKQFGAPIRLILPWKYGFKSIKSIVSMTLTDKTPQTFWNDINAKEYGFWANVNPRVNHPRWSQASERDLETGQRRPTKIFNGYASSVAHLYPSNASDEYFI